MIPIYNFFGRKVLYSNNVGAFPKIFEVKNVLL